MGRAARQDTGVDSLLWCVPRELVTATTAKLVALLGLLYTGQVVVGMADATHRHKGHIVAGERASGARDWCVGRHCLERSLVENGAFLAQDWN